MWEHARGLQEVICGSIQGIDVTFETDPRLFSPKKFDLGTLAMLACVRFAPDDKVLDLGCGYGLVGVVAAKLVGAERVYLIDNDPIAVERAGTNARLNGVAGVRVALSDGFRNFDETGFSQILCNPPYHADFAVPKHFIHKGFNRLKLDGTLWMVTQRHTWYRNKLRSIFGNVREHTIAPYIVFEAVKKSLTYANAGGSAR